MAGGGKMDQPDKTREQLSRELAQLKEQVATLEQKLREADQFRDELERLQFQLEYVLGASKTEVNIIDEHYNLHYVSPEWRERYGDRLDLKCYQYFRGQETVCDNCNIARALSTGRVVITERQITRENNRPVEVHTIPFQDFSGRFFAAEFNIDIRERHAAESTFQNSETRYREMFDHINSGVAVMTPVPDHQNFIVKDFNKAAEDIAKVRREEVIGQSILNVFPQLNEVGLLSAFQRVNKTGKPEQIPAAYYRDVIREGWHENFIYKLPSGEIVTIFDNVTKRVKTERELQVRNQIAQTFLLYTGEESYARVMKIVLAFFESRYGLFGYIENDGSLVIPWMEESVLENYHPGNGLSAYAPHNWIGPWGKALQEGRTCLSNLPGSVPEGHIPIDRALAVPMKYQGQLAGVLAVANRETDYTEDDCHRLEAIADFIAPVLMTRLNFNREEREKQTLLKTLEESERLRRDIIDFLPDATFAINSEGRLIIWNRALEKMTGLRSENMLGRGNYEYAVPFYGCRRPMLIDMVLHLDPEWERQYSYIRQEDDLLVAETDVPSLQGRQNQRFWAKARRLYDSAGNIIGAIESIRDITDRRRAEEALLESEEKFRLLTEETPVGISLMNADWQFEYFNPQFTEILGYTLDEMPTKEVWFEKSTLIRNTGKQSALFGRNTSAINPKWGKL